MVKMARLEEVDKSTLKVGDTVGISVPTQIIWNYFKYSKIIPKTIARITPARTKFVTTDGCEYNRHEVFWKVDNEARKRNHVAECAKRIEGSLYKLNESLRKGTLLNKPDDDIIKMAEILKELCKEIEEEQRT